jgi:amino acid adenylation domain-containing protein/non-ribosomal peptide synthase protein (TIGR01720 family)
MQKEATIQKEITKGFRLSPQQRHLWLLQQAEDNQPYCVKCAVQIEGNLNKNLLKAALQNIVNQHEILRTSFPCLPGMDIPLQVIADKNLITLHSNDLSDLEPHEQEIELEELFREVSQQPFNFEQGLLFHVSLVTLSPDKHILLLDLAALYADTATLKNLVSEISSSYIECLLGKELSDEPLQYADIAEILNELIESEDTETGREYWRKQDMSALATLKLPFEKQPSENSGFAPQCLSLTIAPEQLAKIKALVQKHETSVSVFFLTCWQILLWRLTAQSDTIVGTAYDGRTYEGLEEALGLFAKYLPIRCSLAENLPFNEALAQVDEAIADAYQWQEYFAWEQVGDLTGNGRSPSFFPFCFDFEEKAATYSAREVSFSICKQYACIDRFNVKLACTYKDNTLLAELHYDSHRLAVDDVQRLGTQFQVLLNSVLNNPQADLGQLEILSDRDRQQLLLEFNQTQADYPKDQCVHYLFEQQVQRTPDNLAVVFEDQQLTYAELNAQANQLAHYLQKLGVGPDVMVGLCAERSLEMVVGLLGILKAGGAYVPLDPTYPKQRLAFMLKDSQIQLLLTQQRLAEVLPEHSAQAIYLDADWQMIAEQDSQNPKSSITAENLAYVIYTSGSTGQPKGTMIAHRGLVNYLSWCTQAYAVTQGTGAPVHSSLAFDLTITGLFAPLLVGCRVELLKEDRSIETLSNAVRSGTNFSLIKLTPAQLTLLSQQLTAEEVAGRTRALIIGGENLLTQTLAFWQTHAPETLLVNEYGPTETVVGCCVYSVSQGQQLSGASVPIGRPIANTQLYILDRQLQLVPMGVAGELYIGGAGLARGYLNRPDLTGEKFVPHPFSAEPGERLYKTGDLARYLADGNIEYLGRIDEQVKVRGYRIELGEIEAVLGQHPGVRETAIVPREDEPGQQRLVVYMVPERRGLLPSVRELRSFLEAQLPEYMVPSVFIWLETLPLTSNGKVDRRALPAPDKARPALEEAFVAPRTPVEQQLADIWADVLGLQQVGIHDNFFEVGGDSILSIQIVARANQAGLALTPKQLFAHKTIAELATVAGTTSAFQSEQGLVTGEVILTPIQRWFFEQDLPQAHHWNQAMLLEVRQALNLAFLQQVVQQLLIHHDALRLRFLRSACGWKQVNALPEPAVPLTREDLSALSAREQTAAIEATAAQLQASLNLSEGPLLRVALFDLGTHQSARLLLVIHHLAVDGVSWRILLEDLQTAYQQLCRGETIQFPPKTTSFKYWSQRLFEYAQSQELDYWLATSESFVTRLPVDYVAGKDANTVASAGNVVVTLSSAETRALLQSVPQAYKTQINDVLLTALVQAFAQWTGTDNLLVDLEGHGREEIFDGVDLSRTVGWFTTLFPVLLDLKDLENPGSALKAIKEQLRSIPNQGIGYGLLRYLKEDAQIAEQLRSLPQAEVSFNYLGQFDSLLSPDGMFAPAKESSGAEHSHLGSRSHLLEVNAFVAEGQLQVNWTYSSNLHQQATVESLAQGFVTALQVLIAHCQSPEAGGYTASDFPLAKLDEQKLGTIAALIDKSDGLSTKLKNVEDIYSLSPMQQGMLFHTLYASEPGMYFEQLSCTLDSDLDISAFQRAWQQVVERHPILRTAFFWEGLDEALQVVHQHVSLPWKQHDWRGWSPVEQQTQLEALLQTERERGFDLGVAPLMRLTLIQVTENAYYFIWSHHHLLLDGWSVSSVIKEVFAFYEAFRQGQKLHLERTRPYRNYINWLQQQDLSQAEAFWRQTLQDFSAPTPLGVDRALASFSSEGESYQEQHLQLSVAATAALDSFARQHQLTLNTLVQGVWALLLSRYSGQQDVVFGATVSGRPADLVGVESMVGLFINTLPVRVLVSPEADLVDWLKQLQAQQVELRHYEYSPLVQVQGWSEVPRGLPLFESIVVFENYPVDASLQQEGGSLEIGDVRAVDQTNYPLTLAAVPGSQLSLQLSYDCRRFDADTITRMLRHLQMLLEGIVADSQQRLTELPLLTSAESQQLLVEWNHTQADYPQDFCIHQLFEAQVERTPEAVAVVFGDEQLTYRELNRRANQLAHHLRSLGVGPDVLVGICVQRSLEMVVGLLGILKAGGAYVPLDPTYPQQRLAFMLEDAQVSVLLTQQRLIATLPEHRAVVVQLDGDWSAISPPGMASLTAHNSEANPNSQVTPAHLAYTIYTSGSTGLPKGVLLTHQGLVNHCVAVAKQFSLQSSDRILQFSSISFDVAVEELFPSWLAGATVILRLEDMLPSSRDFLLSIAQQRLTVLNLPTAYWHQWVHELSLSNEPLPDTLRLVVVGGEKPSPTTFSNWRQLAGVNRICWLNGYGPTETTVTATVHQPETNPVTQGATLELPIGRPIANTEIYLLDDQMQPVPVGVPGEIYIGGAGLARGYLNRPDLTADKFIPNPFSPKAGTRLYKTGDLARYLPDGNIEYLGRLDDQVKIRGFRIELGEIERALAQHPAVQETVVAIREDVPGNKRLVAYVVIKGELASTIPDLHEFLKQKLPEYMVPAAIMLLESLPLTPNGKINRRALPEPDTARPELQEAFIAPRDSLELQLAQIWEDVLNVSPIGVTDNFFNLGGHSLLAVRLMAQVQQQFAQNLPLATLFQAPTIEQLATTLRLPTHSLEWSPLVKIQQGGSKRPFFCLPGTGGNVLYFYHLARYLGSDQPFYGLQAQGLNGEQAPHTQVEEMAADYIKAIQTVQPQGPYLLGGHSFGSYVAFEMAQQLLQQGQEVALLALLDTPAPLPNNQPVEIEDDATYLTGIATSIERFLGKKLSVSYEALQPLAADEQLNYLLERLKMVNFFPPEAGLPQIRGLLQVAKANAQAYYLAQEVYPHRITVFRTTEESYDEEPAMGWDKFSSQSVEIYDVPGDHITMMAEPHVQLLAKQLRACLDRVQGDD